MMPSFSLTGDPIILLLRIHLSAVNIDIYKPHSCRSASASHAKIAGVPLEDVLRAGQWKSSDCFIRFYDRVIERTDFTVTQQFANSILDGAPYC